MARLIRKPLFWTNFFAFIFAGWLIAGLAFGWTDPGASPPGGGGAIGVAAGAPVNSVFVATNGNVGIGTANPLSKLQLQGTNAGISVMNAAGNQNWYFGIKDSDANQLYIGQGKDPSQGWPPAIKLGVSSSILDEPNDIMVPAFYVINNAKQFPYYFNLKRYHVEIGKISAGTGIAPLDMATLFSFCGDEDGCKVTIGLRNYDSVNRNGSTQAYGPYILYIPGITKWWTIYTGDLYLPASGQGLDKDGVYQLVVGAGSCLFTDADNAALTDTSYGFMLVNQAGGDAKLVCTLTFED